MEIVSIGTKAFEEMNKALNNLIQMARSRNEPSYRKLDEWIDNQDACLLIGISPRKLQTLRCTRTISYPKIDRKVYYNKADIMRYMENILEK